MLLAKLLLAAALLPLGGQALTAPAATEATGGLGIDSRPAAIVVEHTRPVAQRVELVGFGRLDPATLRYPFWRLDAYVAGDAPLGYLQAAGAATVEPWGNAGLAGGHRDTYRITQPVTGLLPAGQLVVGVEATQPGALLSGADQRRDATYMGAVWQTADGVRGLLPHSITWALDVWSAPLGIDIKPPVADVYLWELDFGTLYDGADLLRWQREASWQALTAVSEADYRAWWAAAVVALVVRTRDGRLVVSRTTQRVTDRGALIEGAGIGGLVRVPVESRQARVAAEQRQSGVAAERRRVTVPV